MERMDSSGKASCRRGALEELVSQSGTKRKVGSRNHRKPLPSHQVLI